MNLVFPEPSAQRLIAAQLAELFDPGEAVTPTEWATKNLVVPDGPRAGEKFSAELTPYLREPLDFFSDDCPDNKAAVRKSKQTGFTTAAICCVGYTADVEPCDVFLIEPTIESLKDFNTEKLQRAIDGSPALRRKILRQKSRSDKGSTKKSKRFAGGSLLLGISTSTADLRGKTRKKIIRDEASEYPADLAGQGSPHDMITGAYTSFLASGDFKDLWISTPVIKGACAIDREFEAGDQRYWHVQCPGCAEWFPFKWDPKFFRFKKSYPHEAHYIAPCCGGVIESWQRNDLVRAGRWIATAPALGKHRSYHFDAFSSPFVPWDVIAKQIVEAGENASKLKTLYNLWFGLPYEMKGSAPDHKALADRAEKLKRYHVPAAGLLLTAFADVQLRGIWLEVVAHAPNRETWTVDAQYLEGDTSAYTNSVFAQLRREVLDREYPDAFGRTRKVDALAVDSGYRAHVVYAFVRAIQCLHPDTGRDVVLATKGLKGWGRPALGMPQLVDIDLDGRKIKEGAKVWGIGTWSLKGSICSDLFLDVPALVEGAPPPATPDGFCHFGDWLSEEYYKQLTAETLQDIVHKGRIKSREWVARGPNHFFDCRVGNVALAEYLGLSSTTPDEWAALAKRRGLPDELTRLDLFTPRAHAPAEASPAIAPVASAPAEVASAAPATQADWLQGHDLNNWIR
jgi:phage terminase large subunit GpA-like protein